MVSVSSDFNPSSQVGIFAKCTSKSPIAPHSWLEGQKSLSYTGSLWRHLWSHVGDIKTYFGKHANVMTELYIGSDKGTTRMWNYSSICFYTVTVSIQLQIWQPTRPDLRGQLTEKATSSVIWERLLMASVKLTYTPAIEIACQVEAAKKGSQWHFRVREPNHKFEVKSSW